jgi:hypothetical protein
LLKDQRNFLILEWIFRQIGRWGGSSRVNEGMGVNRPSVKSPNLTTDGKIHATSNLAEKRKERRCGKGHREREGKRAQQGSQKRMGETIETQRVLNIGEGE